ncbi:MAG: glycine/betaine ABC transporter substrate-binding protein [Chitinivibrionales bacterium]|nr:glycine/betaine ABC transporter substrate-binding protein [Chitinivibrionales bacterium]
MGKKPYLIISIVALVILVAVGLGIHSIITINKKQNGSIIIGTKNFTEQIILGEIMSQLIENRMNVPVKRKFNLGGTFICFTALKNEKLDCYAEYTGTGLVAILKEEVITEPDSLYRKVKEEFKNRWNLLWMPPFGFNNTYTLAMKKSLAESLSISTISDLKKKSDILKAGFNHEFMGRPDGYPGLVQHYNFKFEKSPREMDSGLMYRAIDDGEVDVICSFKTDGKIKAYNLVTLRDDKNFFPPYFAAPLVRNTTVQEYPQLRSVLTSLKGTISDKEMSELNFRVDEKNEDPADVAHSFLLQKDLID